MSGKVRAFLELMRLKNVFLAAITVPLGAHFAIGDEWFNEYLIEVVVQTLAVVFFIGAGNTMNDIKDSDIDKTAHPNRPIPSKRVSISDAKKFTWLLWSLSIGCVIFGVLRLHDNEMQWYPLVAIYVLAVALMMSYDHGPKTKDSGLIGNVSISVMVGAVILYGASSVSSVSSTLVWWTASVVFFTNLAREIVKDCQDMESDEGIRNTLPMSFGLQNSRMAAYVIIMASLVCLYMPYWKGPFEFGQLFFQIPAIMTLITLNKPLYEGKDALVAGRIRIAMLLGLIGFIIPMYV
ncbi:MAG: geranylgeranylglycerol-phosphate geranylgeranyltransferase [Candidatus Poseidoniaceae archaeon]|nr:geranylgeranylglycerol-phosphate geranylgeranyltransferase [Candidatus Poseidoniaceae archaeon]|tara:strand:+ start:763 stop:1641 length:879 start_codon:yes stop_codon:yes gene_type:complete